MNEDSYLLLTTSASPNAKPMTISNIKHSCSNLFPQASVLASFHLAISRPGSNLHKFDGGCCQHLACYLILCLGRAWNNGKEVPRWGLLRYRKWVPQQLGEVNKQKSEDSRPMGVRHGYTAANHTDLQSGCGQTCVFAVQAWSNLWELISEPPSHYSMLVADENFNNRSWLSDVGFGKQQHWQQRESLSEHHQSSPTCLFSSLVTSLQPLLHSTCDDGDPAPGENLSHSTAITAITAQHAGSPHLHSNTLQSQ